MARPLAFLLLIVAASGVSGATRPRAAGRPSAKPSGKAAAAPAPSAPEPAAPGFFWLCNRPGQPCVRIARHPRRVVSTWDCPIFASASKCKLLSRPAVGSERQQAARLPAAPAVNEVAVAAYPKIVSSQQAGPRYHFTAEHPTLEAARRLLKAGATSFKFDLANSGRDGKPVKGLKKGFLPLLLSRDLPYLALLDLPFKTFFFWAGRLPPPGRDASWSDTHGIDVYRETHALTGFLLRRYNGTGKSFFIGHWEGDWAIRDSFDGRTQANPAKVHAMIKLLSDKQRGVDAARAATKHSNVRVFHYAEANLVERSMRQRGFTSMINSVVPKVQPPVDYLSISIGGASLQRLDPTPDLHRVFDYASDKLPAKPGVPQPRVFAGEFYQPLRSPNDGVANTLETQRQRACFAAASGIAWGVPHLLWWQVYDNESTRSGATRGFYLIDPANKDTLLWKALQTYYKDSQDFVRSVLAATGKAPSSYAYRTFAVRRLVQLSGVAGLEPPAVRYWGV